MSELLGDYNLWKSEIYDDSDEILFDEIVKCIKSSKPKQDNAVYLFILKKENEGKPRKVAKVAGMNKFLRIYYARVKEIYTKN